MLLLGAGSVQSMKIKSKRDSSKSEHWGRERASSIGSLCRRDQASLRALGVSVV